MIGLNVAFPIVLTKKVKNHKKRYILKSDSFDNLIEFLDCPNYEERVRIEDKKITFESSKEDMDYYSVDEDEEDASTKLVGAYEEIDFEQMCTDIVKYAEHKGLSTDVLSVRNFLSAVNSSHLIEINSSDLYPIIP